VKDLCITLALICLLLGTFCIPVQADGFKFPTIPNPFKKSAASAPSEPRPARATGTNLADESAGRDTSSFSLPKPKLPKFDLPSFRGEQAESSAGRSQTRNTTATRQSRSNRNRPAEPSVIDKFSRGTKSFFGKAKTTLMPWTEDTASAPSMRSGAPSGSGSRHSTRTNGTRSPVRQASASNGFTFPWSKLKPAAEERRDVNSATDFLKLDRPKYY
jgi:hypothetical protein